MSRADVMVTEHTECDMNNETKGQKEQTDSSKERSKGKEGRKEERGKEGRMEWLGANDGNKVQQ